MRAPSGVPLRHFRPHHPRDLERKAHASLERAAVFVVAAVRQRRHETVQQIAVRHVQLDGVEPATHGTPRRKRKCIAHAVDVVLGHRTRRRPIGAERDRGRRNGLPRIGRRGAALPPRLPRHARGALASGVRELDADLRGTDPMAMVDDARQRRFAGVGIETETTVADAAAPFHVAHFGDHEAGAGIGERAEMRDVPVGRHAVIGAVLAHRGDDDAVREFEVGEPNGREQYAGHEVPVEFRRRRDRSAPHQTR